jgi:hypothetical protein
MTKRVWRARHNNERGFALITVMLAMVVIAALTVVIAQNIVSSLDQNSHQVQVTDSRSAADAGVTDLLYSLQQSTNGVTNWSTWPSSYATPSGCAAPCETGSQSSLHWYGWQGVGRGQFRSHIDGCSILSSTRQISTACNSQTDLVLTIEGQYPATTGATQTLQAVIRGQGGPAAFNYTMFGDTGIQIHHHNDSYVSPTIVTTSLFSNGDITLNYPAVYRVGSMQAVGSVKIADGGGSTPGGNVTTPYNWAYWISGSDSNNPPRCYPALQYPALSYPAAGSSNSYWEAPTGSGTTSSCGGDPVWSPNAVVLGDIQANSVEVTKNGDTQQPTNASYQGQNWSPQATGSGSRCGPTNQLGFTDPITGSCIPDDNANIDSGSVKFDLSGQTFTGPNTGTNAVTVYTQSSSQCPSGSTCDPAGSSPQFCTDCNQGTSDLAGHIGGQVNLHKSSWALTPIPFPALNYQTTTYTVALSEQTGGPSPCTYNCHIFPTASSTSFTTWMQTASNVYYNSLTMGSPGTTAYSATVNPCLNTYCMTWLDANKNYTNVAANVAYIVLRGNYEITGNNALNLAENTLRSGFGTTSTGATPTVMVAGALVDEKADISLTASLTVVGPTMDPFNPLQPDSQLPQGFQTVPGLLASGGNGNAIQSTDYDTDNPYTSTSNYQGLYKNTVIVRGLVYTGTWSSSTSASTSDDQHWHNSDPKNAQVIVGAQIGGLLHDCSNFTFDYDPIIQNLQGFSGGGGTSTGAYVLDWVIL